MIQANKVLIILLTLATLALNIVPAAHAASPVKILLNGVELSSDESSPIIVNETTYVPLRFIAEKLQAVVDWNAKTKIVTVVFPGHTFQIQSSITKNGKTYVPIRFFAKNLGAQVIWKSRPNRVDIVLSNKYAIDWAKGNSAVFWFDKTNGDLFQSMPYTNKPQNVGRLDFSLHEFVTLTVDWLDGNRFTLTLHDNSGEPHINDQIYSAYVADGKLLRQATVLYSHMYSPSVNRFGNQAVITDGKQLQILKANGETDKQYNLAKLGGQQGTYAVEYMGKSYWLIRSYPNRLLIWVDPETGARKHIYEYFNNKLDQEIALAWNDTPNFGDGVSFKGEKNSVLHFEYLTYSDTGFKKAKLQIKLADISGAATNL